MSEIVTLTQQFFSPRELGDYPSKGDILVVDDNPNNVRLLFTMLTKQGYEVRQVIRGSQALQAVHYDPPELILLDVMMPDIDGYEVCRILKENPKTRDIPVIFFSAKIDEFDKVKGFRLGAVDYITKPFYVEEVLCRISTHITIKRQKQLLEKLATLDFLTEVANRYCFDRSLNYEWERSKREKFTLSLIIVDIDYFKRYNDTYGHLAGDECLKSVAKGLRNSLKRSTDLLARYGGEEFGIILPNTDIKGAKKVAQELRLGIQKLKIVHSASTISDYVTLSLGVATVKPTEQLSPHLLIKTADKALYQAKHEGRDRIIIKNMEYNT